jgi:hypothetical protein
MYTEEFPEVYQYVTRLTAYMRGSEIDELLDPHFRSQEPSLTK